jgi:integrase
VAFKAAEREGRLSRNPCDRIDPPRKSTAKQEALDLDEAVAVLEFVASLGNVILGARWATSILTGARRGEVLGIERDRITRTVNPKTGAEEWSLDLSWQLQRLPLTERDGRPNVPADFEYRHLVGGLYLTRPKSSAGWRVIPLVDPLRSILLRILDLPEENPYGLLFSINGRPMDPDQDSKRWREVLAAAGIERDVVLHGLRHTAIDLLYLAGVPEDITMQIVGQATLSVTRGYQSRGAVNRARMFAALEQFSALFNSRDAGTRPAIDV